MLENAIKITTSKLVSTSLLSGSLILIGGIVVWRLWRKQTQLQTQTTKMLDELTGVKKQMAELKVDRESEEAPLSSSFKKLASLNPWSTK